MSPGQKSRLSIDLAPATLKKFQKACEDAGRGPEKALGQWVQFIVKRHRNRAAKTGPFHLIPGEGKPRAESPDESLKTRLQVRVREADRTALKRACKKRGMDLSSILRNWVDYILEQNQKGENVAAPAEPAAFKKNRRELVFETRLQIRMLDVTTLNKFRRMCQDQRLDQSRLVRGWLAHILKLHKDGGSIEPPKTRRLP